MKKSFKILGITLLSIICVVLLAASIACFVIFTPERLTPIVRNNANKIVTCQTELEKVELTFFSTFPHFALQISNIQLINPTEEAQSDTLLAVETISATVNVSQFLFRNNVVIDQLLIANGIANLYTDSTGTITNYDIMVPSEEEPTDTTEKESNFSLNLISLNSIVIDNINASYIDLSSGINAHIKSFETVLNGEMEGANANISSKVKAQTIDLLYNDSTSMEVNLNDITLNADGDLRDNHFDGEIVLSLPTTTFVMDNDTLLNKQTLLLNAPLEVNLDIMHIALKNSLLALNEHQIKANGPIQLMESGDINMDVTLTSNYWDIEQLIKLVPTSYSDLLSDFKKLNGSMNFSAHASGTYNDSIMPLIKAELNLNEGEIVYNAIPYPLNNVHTSMSATIDMNNQSATEANIHTLHAETGSMSFDINGSASDIMNDPYCNVNFKGNINLPELKPILPDDMNVDMVGRTNANITAKFLLSDAVDMKLNKLRVDGNIAYTALDVVYEDSMKIRDNKGVIELKMPSTHKNNRFKELGEIAIKGDDINFEMVGSMNVDLTKPNLSVGFGDLLDTTQFYTVHCGFDIDKIVGEMDTIKFDVQQPTGTAILSPSKRNKKNPSLAITYASNSIDANMGNAMDIDTKRIAIKATTVYNDKEENMLLKWNPTINVDFNDGNLSMTDFDADINIPAIKFIFRPDRFKIDTSRIVIGESDFSLSGEATNIRKYIKKKDLLIGEFNFISDNTNIDELMDLVNGFGSEEDEEVLSNDENVDYAASNKDENTVENEEEEANPFIVPKGVDITLTTKLRKANFSDNLLENVNGKLTIKDGILVAEQMGFTSDAAKMQITGMYRSDRFNHLFCGVDFHLLDIDIKRLIEMIPSIDTIVPMLKSFDGDAEFHLAAESYLDAYYNPKMSTIRGAAAIEGKELVLMDSELFSTISKYMMFDKKTENVIDSLSVEMTVFRNEVDLYPFLVSMDKWQAVLSGRHNLDMNFDYHISLTKCPLPARLGLDVKGNLDDMKFNLVPCKYKNLYKPEKAGVTEKQVLSIKKIISESLKKNVKEETLDATTDDK